LAQRTEKESFSHHSNKTKADTKLAFNQSPSHWENFSRDRIYLEVLPNPRQHS